MWAPSPVMMIHADQVWHVLCLRHDHLQRGKAFKSPRIGSEDARLGDRRARNIWHHDWPSHFSLG